MAAANFGNRPEYQARLANFQDDTTTDDQGRFQLLVPAAGETLLSIWPAKDFALSNEYIADKRGDVGTIALKLGRALLILEHVGPFLAAQLLDVLRLILPGDRQQVAV